MIWAGVVLRARGSGGCGSRRRASCSCKRTSSPRRWSGRSRRRGRRGVAPAGRPGGGLGCSRPAPRCSSSPSSPLAAFHVAAHLPALRRAAGGEPGGGVWPAAGSASTVISRSLALPVAAALWPLLALASFWLRTRPTPRRSRRRRCWRSCCSSWCRRSAWSCRVSSGCGSRSALHAEFLGVGVDVLLVVGTSVAAGCGRRISAWLAAPAGPRGQRLVGDDLLVAPAGGVDTAGAGLLRRVRRLRGARARPADAAPSRCHPCWAHQVPELYLDWLGAPRDAALELHPAGEWGTDACDAVALGADSPTGQALAAFLGLHPDGVVVPIEAAARCPARAGAGRTAHGTAHRSRRELRLDDRAAPGDRATVERGSRRRRDFRRTRLAAPTEAADMCALCLVTLVPCLAAPPPSTPSPAPDFVLASTSTPRPTPSSSGIRRKSARARSCSPPPAVPWNSGRRGGRCVAVKKSMATRA